MDISRQLTPVQELGQELSRSLGLAASRDRTLDAFTGMGLLAAGIALGVSLGLLFAPSSGRQLRSDLSRRIDELRPSGNDSGAEQPSSVV